MSNTTLELKPVELATELTIAWLSNPNIRTTADEVTAFFKGMYEAVSALMFGSTKATEPKIRARECTRAVTTRKSLSSPDHIVSMIDGKLYKTLRRHLATNGMTPTEYRERYGLKADYPMVAPTYSEARRTIAKSIGLGRKPGVGSS